jgi:hypothetical protein
MMKQFLLVLTMSVAAASAAELADVRKVYLLPMSNSLDQYLANRIAGGRLFEVVTDPALADAVFTDRLGEGFETKMTELLPPPPAPKAAEPAKEKDEAKADKDKKEAGPEPRGDFAGEPVNKLAKAGSMSSLARARGTVFLVGVQSKQVLWSAFEQARDTTPKQMDLTAAQLVARIKREMKKK